MLSYTSPDYSPDFLSPFSSNDTTLRNQRFGDTSLISDKETMWELDTVVTLKQRQQWRDLSPKPSLIGPDKASVSHTLNVLDSYSDRATWIRPDYKSYFDIRGTQSRYVDSSATETNFKALSDNGLEEAWCTMCSQEWYRQVGAPLGGVDDGRRLLGPRAVSGYWSNYDVNRGRAQPPASQALLGKMRGFVAEAAVPRFVDKLGNVNPSRNWGEKERMVNADGNTNSYDIEPSTKDRNAFRPIEGFRRTLDTAVETQRCTPYGEGGPEDRVLEGYQGCSFELTRKDFEQNKMEPIVLYVDTPRSMYSFIETCKTGGQKLCDTEELPAGREYRFKYTENWAVRLIFENDGSEEAIFQIDFTTESGERINGAYALLTGGSSLLFLLYSILF